MVLFTAVSLATRIVPSLGKSIDKYYLKEINPQTQQYGIPNKLLHQIWS